MAALLQTGTLVDGQWTTTNVDINTVLERHMERKPEELQSEAEKAPFLGILTQTVIQTPVFNWIISARIRSSAYHDVVFIGDNFVQIRRVGSDGMLHDVAKKTNFGSRIRNARVVGGNRYSDLGVPPLHRTRYENEDVTMSDAPTLDVLPLQYILLALESGDLVLFYTRNVGSEAEFVTFYQKTSKSLLRSLPGRHLAVDPSSRYIAVAGYEDAFSIFALQPREILIEQCLRGEPFSPILATRDIRVNGAVHKIEFLFPASDDPNHIILLVLVIKGGTTNMFIYDWDARQALTDIRTYNIAGHPLPRKYRMPILLIPLVIKSACLMVFGESIIEWHNLLTGTPEYRSVASRKNADTQSFLGTGMKAPIWTAWVRPMRTRRYFKEHDDIYIAREDGFVAYFEINSDGHVQCQSDAGTFKGNIGTAFASLEMDLNGRDRDFLVAGGEGCDGGVYMVAARQDLELVELIPNWSPALDFVTTAHITKEPLPKGTLELSAGQPELLSKPDRIFACTGRGHHGAISEIRYGYEARIKLAIEGLNYPLSDTWVLPLTSLVQDDIDSDSPIPLLFLFVWGNSSLLLHLTADGKVIEEIEQASTGLDLKYRTIAVATFLGLTVQITEGSFNVIDQLSLYQHDHVQDLPYKELYTPQRKIVAGAVNPVGVALIMHQDEMKNLYLSAWRIQRDGINDRANTSLIFSGVPRIKKMGLTIPFADYPSWISIIEQSDGSIFVTVCTSTHDDAMNLVWQSSVFRLDDVYGLKEIDPSGGYWPFYQPSLSNAVQEPCVSIANLRGPKREVEQPQLLLAGYRDGLLVMKNYKLTSAGTFQETRSFKHYLGSTPVIFKVDPAAPNIALICCDSKLWRITLDNHVSTDPHLHRVWFTDNVKGLPSQPSVDHVAFLPQGVLVVENSQLITTTLDPQEKPVPRAMRVYGSPSRVIYSRHFDMLITGIMLESKSTLVFLNPESGDLLQCHYDQAENLLDFPLGLGVQGGKVLCLAEWKIRGVTEEVEQLLIVGTSDGNLLIYKMKEDEQQPAERSRPRVRCIAYHATQYQGQVTSVLTRATSFFICVDQIVYWASLDIQSKKLLTHARYEAPSAVLSISADGHWLNVLTAKHSLISLLLVDRNDHLAFAEHHGQLVPQLTDEVERNGFDQIPITNEDYSEIAQDSTCIIVSDRDCSVTGLWYQKKGQSLGRTYGTAFEASLPTSILKFRFGRTRPPYDKTWKAIDTGPIAKPTRELLGLGIDGSITHFTLLGESIWQLLVFLQDLACPPVNDYFVTYHVSHILDKSDPRKRHVNGDILRPYIYRQNLEKLLMVEEKWSERGEVSVVLNEFCRLVNVLNHGVNTPGQRPTERSLESCLEIVQGLLADLFRPVL